MQHGSNNRSRKTEQCKADQNQECAAPHGGENMLKEATLRCQHACWKPPPSVRESKSRIILVAQFAERSQNETARKYCVRGSVRQSPLVGYRRNGHLHDEPLSFCNN